MTAKKKTDDEPLSAQDLVEARVDAMMDPRPDKAAAAKAEPPVPSDADDDVPAPDEATAHTDPAETGEELPPLDIFSADKGAPALPKDLKVKVDKGAKPQGAKTPAPAAVSEAAAPTSADAADIDTALDDAKSDAAVDDIVAQEGDVVLAATDAGIAQAQATADAAAPKPKKRHPIFWFLITLAVIVIIFTVLLLTVPSISNHFGG